MLVVICGDESECKWVRLVMDWVQPHLHAGNAGCRSDDENDMAGVRD